MGLRFIRVACTLAAVTATLGWGLVANACDQCSGGEASHRSYSVGISSGGCDSCGSCSTGRCSNCTNGPRGCRDCPPSPDRVDCCSGCGGKRKTVFGCGWRTWDLIGYWGCSSGCGLLGGCGEIYRGDYASDPPECCDPCDGYGNWIGHGGYRARYNPAVYSGGTYYDSTYDFGYGEGDTFSDYQQPAYGGSMQRRQASASRIVPSTARRPVSMNNHSQARQIPRQFNR